MKLKTFCLIVFIFCKLLLFGQQDTTLEFWKATIQLDSVVIRSSKVDFDIDHFIKIMLADQSLYKSFKSVRSLNYKCSHKATIYTSKHKIKDSLLSTTEQFFEDGCREMKTINKVNSANYFDHNGSPRCMTMKVYERLFIPTGKYCENDNLTQNSNKWYILALKNLIFRPGHDADVPIIGNKFCIFSNKMSAYYDYKLSKDVFDNQTCYKFDISLKSNNLTDPTIIKRLTTYFSTEDLEIIYRYIDLQYSTSLYSFNVQMKIALSQIKGSYLPSWIIYNGDWDYTFKKPEIVKVVTRFSY